MISGTLAEAARWSQAQLLGADGRYRGLSTDTRSLAAGALFVALRGEHFDAHDFLPEVARCGAAGALVSRACEAPLPQLRVTDTRAALGALATAWRRTLKTQLIAITGSNGKTTVKEMLAAILSARGPVLATRGNRNNEIGVPLTLCELAQEHRAAVVEMGCSAPGEIAYLSAMAGPEVALINNAGPAHLEGFGSVERVAQGKGEIFSGLDPAGTAVFNGDDPYAPLWRQLAGDRRPLAFGFGAHCEVRGETLPGPGNRMRVHVGSQCVELVLPLSGRHNVMNALAAAAAGWAAGESLETVARGLERVTPVPGRLQQRPGLAGSTLVDDSYNANPASLLAAMQSLAAGGGRYWLVLGDMAELGEAAPAMHTQAGRDARDLGFERLYAVGPLSAEAAAAFDGGARHHRDLSSLLVSLQCDLAETGAGVCVLVKGSRSARMERVVAALESTAGSG
jgi:UDP-N-acetylmuramoyl-tripeptide--D-alanyl-D-alanine ligase